MVEGKKQAFTDYRKASFTLEVEGTHTHTLTNNMDQGHLDFQHLVRRQIMFHLLRSVDVFVFYGIFYILLFSFYVYDSYS